MTFSAAFFKGTKPGLAGVYNRAVRLWTNGPYSHCELIFSNGVAASASYMDHGVRFKKIEFDSAKWDIIQLPDDREDFARVWFEQHDGLGYDLLGNAHFVVGAVRDDKDRWFCSEAVAAALGIESPWRYDPNTLHSALAFATTFKSLARE